jgi:hypothetical protein
MIPELNPPKKNQTSILPSNHPTIHDFLPPLDKELVKTWRSPLAELAKEFREPTIEQITKEDFDAWRLSLSDS